MQSASSGKSSFIIINGEPISRILNRPGLWLFLFVLVVFYVIYRDHTLTNGPSAPPPPSANKNQPLLDKPIYAPRGNSAGVGFNIPSRGNYHITIKNSTGNNVVINELHKKPATYSFLETNFEGERYFEQGDYVISLNAKKSAPANALIKIQSSDTGGNNP